MTEDNKVDAESANMEVDRFLEEMDIESDRGGMDEEDRAGFDNARATIVRAIRRGRLVINDSGEPVYTPASVDTGPITFHEPTGAAFMEMDRRKKGQDVSKMYAIMAGMTKQHAKVFSDMRNRDLKVCQAVTTLFLG